MKKGNKKLFLDEEKLQEMLELRKGGWSYNALAKKYGCDHTSIIYQCQKHKIKNQFKMQILNIKDLSKKIKNDWTEDEKNKAIEMRKNGVFTRIIAGKIGKTIHRVNRFFSAINLPATTTPSQRARVIKEKCLWQEDETGEKVCLGKNYKEYLKEDKKKEKRGIDKIII